jgi:hypothetical protein
MSGTSSLSTGGLSVVLTKEIILSRAPALSNTFLKLAYKNFYSLILKNFIISIIDKSNNILLNNVEKLLRYGNTSGSDIATGFIFAIENMEYIIT